jgi:predicted Zn-ribbon and HTH transcriptional regulator
MQRKIFLCHVLSIPWGETMSVMQKLKSVLPFEDAGVTKRTYECQDCGNTFESAKTPDRAMCVECMSQDVREQEETTV